MRLALRPEIRALEQELIRDGAMPSAALMETAGRGLAADIQSRYGHVRAARIACGRGNNGGDGFVVARYLREAGWAVRVHLVGLLDELSGEPAAYARLYGWLGGRIEEWPEGNLPPGLPGELQVDALLGTGLDRPVEGAYGMAVEALNDAVHKGLSAYAIDVPSGLDADSGTVLGVAVEAASTGTLGVAQPGLYVTARAGDVRVIDIGLPQSCVTRHARTAVWLAGDEPVLRLRPRAIDSHKGTFGHLLVLAGSPGKAGAADLVCRGAIRSGAGLVTLSAPEPVRAGWPEIMHEPIERWSADAWREGFLSRKTALAVGPGMEATDGVGDVVRAVAGVDLPLVLDADGLNVMAGQAGYDAILARRRSATVLTPHPAEAARLLGVDTSAVQADRVRAVRHLAEKYRAVVVLKGARSLVACPDGRFWINGSGSSALAAGGMGDVLTGLIGGLLAAGYDAEHAACIGVYAHGKAGAGHDPRDGKAGGIRAAEVADALPRELAALVATS